jgi:glutamate carboxypeptidase
MADSQRGQQVERGLQEIERLLAPAAEILSAKLDSILAAIERGQIIAIDGMTTDDCTFSVGIVHGGQWVNCVATTCTGEALSMAKRQADLDRGVERMLALSGSANDVTFKVTRGVTRPVWEPDAGTMALYEKARGIAREMGLELPHASAGGGSDGNFTGALGIPTLDGLGVRGADAHTLNEHIEVDSLAERGRLMAGLLATLE